MVKESLLAGLPFGIAAWTKNPWMRNVRSRTEISYLNIE